MDPPVESPLAEMPAETVDVTAEEILAVTDAMRRVPLTTLFGGFEIEAFEREFAELFGAPFAVAVTSGTSALVASLRAAKIGPGDEVIVTPFSFIASVSAVVEVGATPVFADIDIDTLVLDPEDVERKVGRTTKAILPVHQCGYPADMQSLLTTAKRYELTLIEDCAAAHGAVVNGKYVGTIGDFGCFSFNIGKIIRTGEGGMVLSSNADGYERLKAIRVNGLVPSAGGVRVANFGTNYSMSQLLAALGRVQLRMFPDMSARRREIGEQLRVAWIDLPFTFVPDRPGRQRAYYSMPLRLSRELAPARDAIVRTLRARNVPMQGGNAQLLHQVDYVRRVAKAADCPVAEAIHGRLMYIDPIPTWSDSEVRGIIEVVRSTMSEHARY